MPKTVITQHYRDVKPLLDSRMIAESGNRCELPTSPRGGEFASVTESVQIKAKTGAFIVLWSDNESDFKAAILVLKMQFGGQIGSVTLL